MREEFKSFDALENELLDRLKARGYTSVTITGYRYLCNSIIAWLQDNGFGYYTQERGNVFLQDYYSKHGNNPYYSNLKMVIFRLNDLLDDKWKDAYSDKGKHFVLSAEFLAAIEKYCAYETGIGLAAGTIKYKRYATSWFFDELEKLQCASLEQLSPRGITIACAKITDHNLWGEIRVFLRYLTEVGELSVDYSTLVPHYSKPCVVPSVYSIDEIQRIEDAIETSTMQGKRDYAIILLASRMGMRSGDIVKLKMEDIRNRNGIDIIQEKTGNTLHLPLSREVMAAIEDYLSIRPPSAANEIFLNVYAPHNPITTGTIRNALKKYIVLADIDIGNRKKGPHSLRSSLASSMVNDDIPYETVRKILGHSSNNAIKHYARIDVEKLRLYCLEPPEVSGNFKAFLQGEVI